MLKYVHPSIFCFTFISLAKSLRELILSHFEAVIIIIVAMIMLGYFVIDLSKVYDN